MDAPIQIDGQQQEQPINNTFQDLSIHVKEGNDYQHDGICAICLNKIVLEETALVKGCEHAYCVFCILRWATYKKEPTCPQCKHPFEFLNIHRSLDGSIHDYMFEESVCLLLRASWFHPLHVENHEVVDEHVQEDSYPYGYDEEEDDEDLDEVYLGRSSNINIRIGNRRWGNNGFVRAGKQEARPVNQQPQFQDSGAGSSSREPKKKEASAAKDTAAVGRRAKRTLKREAADKAAAAKHQQHLVRLGRN
uniref:Putative RING/U-box superfamily protein n=1 Tax=Tanacetum cinerariifolium TaxID=118510 RepID=A0A6L2M7R5_TANCI|nr:putative RING/U-box superfamily protein [Tanacetum cinerariifolium]